MALPLKSDVFEVGAAQALSGAADPTVGVAAPIGSLFLQTTAGTFWTKTGALDTEWTQVGASPLVGAQPIEVIDTTATTAVLPTGGQTYSPLPPSVDTDILFQFQAARNASNLTIEVNYAMSAAMGGLVLFEFGALATGEGEDPDMAITVTGTVNPTPGITTDLRQASITLALPTVENDLVSGRLTRQGTNGADTHTADARVFTLRVEYS